MHIAIGRAGAVADARLHLAAQVFQPSAGGAQRLLGTLARFPTKKEQAVLLALFREAGSDRRAAVEDALWVLLNTKEFVYNQ